MTSKFVDSLLTLEGGARTRLFHGEFLVLVLLFQQGEMASLQILKSCDRSISSHGKDLRRLLSIGIIRSRVSAEDRRLRLYSLTSKGRNLIRSVIEIMKVTDLEEHATVCAAA